MKTPRDKYQAGGVDFFAVRNRNEIRVVECMDAVLKELKLTDIPEELLHDVYAYTLNQLPARYAQTGTIILRDPVRKETILAVVKESINHVLDNPKK